ncbi:MAG: hypothetical protein C7B46_11430 [Sulfobacillus benefaciens]|uniref:Glycosyltransferase family 1 protein n=1 Tax=Sulfobacillus benefaciens TaxID=453960 RepID=A0A2T2XF83_9FIRM|nr:MAG: hypothetical protein C7B46_11430 [Sulfobacillus benefaciens]
MIVVRPTAAFQEIAELLGFAFEKLGCHSSVVRRVVPSQDMVVLGPHVLSPSVLATLPPSAILYNLEQLPHDAEVFESGVREAFFRHPVWDYSRQNCRIWREQGVEQVVWVPIGYMPELSRISAATEQDIDVLFFGTPSDRRLRILDQLKTHGIRVVARFNVWGPQRDELISRAKVVLNMHYYPTHIFEIVRVSYLLANHKAVVTECDPDTEIEDDLRDAVYAVPYGDLVEAICWLLAHPEERERLSMRGFVRMAARDEVTFVSRALAQSGLIC